MELLKTKELKISTNIFRKICRELKMEIKDNRNQLEKLNKLDYEYNKKIIDLEELTKRIDFFLDKDVVERKTLNNVVSLYGDPYCVIDIMLSAVMNCQIVNILIEDMCVGVNKLIVTLYQEILKDYKIHDIISLNNNVGKKELEEKKNIIDVAYFLGNKNFYSVCEEIDGLNSKYIAFNNIDIYCEDDDLYELAKNIFDVCVENGIEAEIFENMSIDEVIDALNNFGEHYCSLILTKDDKKIENFKKDVKSEIILVNENPFNNKEIFKTPQIF